MSDRARGQQGHRDSERKKSPRQSSLDSVNLEGKYISFKVNKLPVPLLLVATMSFMLWLAISRSTRRSRALQ